MSVRGSIAAALACVYDAIDELAAEGANGGSEWEKRLILTGRDLDKLVRDAPDMAAQI